MDTAHGAATQPEGRLGAALWANRRIGRPSLVVYLTGGLPDAETTTRLIEACAVAGADAIELGIPFSDPIMDGPVIQAASQAALDAGATPESVLSAAKPVAGQLPVGFMTYTNLVGHAGWRRFAAEAAAAGLCAGTIPDLPLEEAGDWLAAADANGIEPILFAAPTSPDARIVANAQRTRGFLYAVGTMGVTGERDQLAATAQDLAARAKRLTDKTVLVGVGVSNAEQARQAAQVADGVIVGTSVVRRVLEAASVEAAVEAVSAYVAELRAGLDDLGVAQPAGAGSRLDGCELCEAAKLTPWHFEDELCWIADCEICDVPMVVSRTHGLPTVADETAMVARLRAIAEERLGVEGEQWNLDGNRRLIPDHYHVHARRRWSL